ncbi:MAG: helix-turn-helix domain-containing protein [Verrucomicrobia bacterium]|nr:helix-turn-helix domain-containing protein [Verrucomicrobiota bacterium]
MVESVGKKLQQARVAKKLEIEDVAELTKIRPGSIIDLEADEYSHFPNPAYAKSFLAKYARFLELDVQDALDKFQISPGISIGDYQYLRSSPGQYQAQHPRWTQRIQPKGFRVPPAVVVVLVLIVLVGVPMFSYLALNIPRVTGTNFVDGIDKANSSAVTPAKTAGTAPLNIDPHQSIATPSPSEESAAPASLAGPRQQEVKTNTPPVRTEGGIEVRRALPAGASQSVSPVETPIRMSRSPAPEKKLEVRAFRRTYVKVTKDEAGTQPVFEGFAGPDSRPIVVEGKRFWIHVMDKGAVEVREDGQVVPGNSGDIVVD